MTEEKEKIRQEFLDDTKLFLQRCQNTFSNVLQELEWSPSHFVEVDVKQKWLKPCTKEVEFLQILIHLYSLSMQMNSEYYM